MSSYAEQDNNLIADCDGAMQANHEFNRRCEEDWDDKSIRPNFRSLTGKA
jgi:hypothetical protein